MGQQPARNLWVPWKAVTSVISISSLTMAVVRSQRAEDWLPSNKLRTDTCLFCVCTNQDSRNVNNR